MQAVRVQDHKREVVNGVADELHAMEAAIDAAIVQATKLVGAIVEARHELKLSPVVAAEAQAKVMESLTALSVARTAAVESHGEFAKTHRKLGLGKYAFGPLDKPDNDTPMGPVSWPREGTPVPAARNLRSV